MNDEQRKIYNSKKEQARNVCANLAGKYKTSVCKFDPTAVKVREITEKEHAVLCRTLQCSGTYREQYKTGIILNFGEYK